MKKALLQTAYSMANSELAALNQLAKQDMPHA
jgi:hypothetical protein